jgi:murein hydrolase activator
MRKKITLCLTCAIAYSLFCGILFSCFSADSFAASPRDEYKKVQKDLRKQKKKLVEATRVEKSVVHDIRMVDSQIGDIEDQMSVTKKQMSAIRGNISVLEGQIAAGAARIKTQRQRLSKRLRTLQKINDSKEIMLLLISNEEPSTLMRISRSIAEISMRYSDSIKAYNAELAKLTEQKRKLDVLAGNLRFEEQSLFKLENAFKMKKKEKETLLVSVRKEKETYQRMIKELREDSGRLQRLIRDSERRDRSYKGKGAKGPQDKHDPLPVDSEFTRTKGRLPWPVQGKVAIKYGSQIDPIFNLPVFRSGIHIKSKAGSTVKSVWRGKVVYAAEFKGYGKLVVVSHGYGYHSLYGNLSEIFLKNDAIIKENEAVGAVGDSNAIGSSGLYFEIRYKGKPLDPRQWLMKSGG